MKELSLEELQSESLSILRSVHKWCLENEVTYFLAYGSLLGAIRHCGFIPWDDDIDIMMPRPDYERFFASFSCPGLEAVSGSADEECYIAFGRVRQCDETKAVSRIPWVANGREKGCWIDVFPLDGSYDTQPERDRRFSKIHKLYRQAVRRRKLKGRNISVFGLKRVVKTAFSRLLHPLWYFQSPRPYIEQINEELRRIPYGSTSTVTQLTCPDNARDYYPVECFAKMVPHIFEGEEFMIPVGYDTVLRQTFSDYMSLPPEKARIPLQKDYIKFYSSKRDLPGYLV